RRREYVGSRRVNIRFQLSQARGTRRTEGLGHVHVVSSEKLNRRRYDDRGSRMLPDPAPQCAAGAGINQDRWNTCSLKVYRGGAHREIPVKDDRRRRTRGMGGNEFLNHQAIAAAVL